MGLTRAGDSVDGECPDDDIEVSDRERGDWLQVTWPSGPGWGTGRHLSDLLLAISLDQGFEVQWVDWEKASQHERAGASAAVTRKAQQE